VLRTPLLPLATLDELSAGLEAPGTADAALLADALKRDRERVRGRLRDILAQPLVREAIFVASPDLERAIDGWQTDPDSDRGQAAERGLFRYVTRMASRPTPFGLFAGIGVGTVGDTTRLAVPAFDACRRHTRLDMDYLVPLAESLARDEALSRSLRYSPNTSLHRSADRWHYVETRPARDARTHHLVAIDDAEPLRLTLERARGGATRADLAGGLVDKDITLADAEAYVDELIAAQVLVPELECPVTGEEPLACLIAMLRARAGGTAAADRLEAIAGALATIDAAPRGNGTTRYADVARALEPFAVPIVPAKLFQVDLIKPDGEATLGRDIVAEIARGVALLRRLTPAPTESPLARFRAAFIDRYEQREVPLLDVLDEETGIGSLLSGGHDRDGSPLLEGIDFPAVAADTVPWTYREIGLMRRVGHALAAGRDEISLGPRDVDELATKNPPPLPPAYAAMATLFRVPPARAGGRDDVRVLLQSASGPSGATLLGRFCHGDAALTQFVRDHLRSEESSDPDAVFAEIAHLPEGRIGNILLRPLLRDHEIVYLARSGAPTERQLPITDLMLSVAEDRFVIRSARLGRRVIPRLTSAHNFARASVGVYRFLCMLQSDGYQQWSAWSWGPLEHLPFLPRVTSGKLVLSRARWSITAAEIRGLRDTTGPARYQAAQRWRAARRLPRWVVLADYDHTLVVDLENVISLDSLVQMLRDRTEARLVEWYPGPAEAIAEGPDGRYAHEIVVPMTGDLNPPAQAAVAARSDRAASGVAVARHALPGSPWVYVKIYTGPATADRILLETIGPLSRTLVDKGAIDRWFFIRYGDPDHHLRWRLQAASARDVTAVRKAVEKTAAALFGDGRIHRVAFETYHREVERYGGPDALDLAEQLFHVDSEATLRLLATLTSGTAGPQARWQAAIMGVDRLLADLGFDVARRLALMRRTREDWARQLRVDAGTRRQFGKRFRALEPELQGLLSGDLPEEHPLAAVHEIFEQRSEHNRSRIERLHALEREGVLIRPLAQIAESYVHMHLNRLFRAEQNLHEVVIYDFLVQLYTRQIARRGDVGAAE
jgi:thiopeptide-type bacteriocin biosynthesis protein